MRREEEQQIASIAGVAGVSNVKCVYWDSPVGIGDICQVAIQFSYKGPATIVRAYTAIGTVIGWVFNEKADSGWKDVEVPHSPWTVTMLTYLYVPITSALDPADSPYDLYGKIDGLFPDTSPHYHDVIEIEGAPPVETETLEIDITPRGTGYVTTDPPPLDRENHFEHNDTGEFEYGIRVRVTAHPYVGYEFDHWSDEIEGGTSTNNPEWVADTMTEHRAVKAHFREIVAETETLEVHIDPEGAGYVTTSPPPTEGANHFEHGDTREFEHGVTVEVTAYPYEGYVFESWSGEMADTSDNPAPVYPMTEHRRITAHFTEIVSEFSGMIEEVKPTQFAVGDLIKILVDFKAYAHNPIDWPNWTTKLTATINGMRDEDDQSHIGEEGHRTEQPLRLGTMPDRNLSGTVKLEAKGEWLPGGWQLLDTRDITITYSEGPPPPPCEPGEWKCVGPDMWGCINGEWVFVQANAPECVLPPEKKFPWVAAALIGGGAAVAIAATAKKPKKSGA